MFFYATVGNDYYFAKPVVMLDVVIVTQVARANRPAAGRQEHRG